MIWEILKAILLGLVEGITEWLPISSTGHMIIVNQFVQLDVSTGFLDLFLIVIQLGAILAVIVLYFRRLNPFSRQKTALQRRATWRLWLKVLGASIPAAILGLLLDDWVTAHLFNAVVVALALMVYGVAFILVERLKSEREPLVEPSTRRRPAAAARRSGEELVSPATNRHFREASSSEARELNSPAASWQAEDLPWPRAIGIGCFQVLAIIPGTSRSGSTILGGRLLGVSRQTAAEFSFFLAIPVMFGWSLIKVLKTLVLEQLAVSATEWMLLGVGVLVAFLVSLAAIRFLISFIQRHSFAAFGWYRIILGVVVLAYFALSGQLLG